MNMQTLTIENKWDTLSFALKRWEHIVNTFLHPISIAMLEKVSLAPDALVLDVATGMGEPGLTAASSLVEGSVTAIDISENDESRCDEQSLNIEAKEEVRYVVKEQCKTHLVNGRLYFQWASVITFATKP
jgi:hypothetical protein